MHFPNFGFKTLISRSHSSYELQTWYEYSYIILLHYTRCKSQVWVGRAAASIAFENRRFMPLVGSSPLGTGGLLRILTLDLWSRRPKLLINQVWSPRLLLPWNGDKLKSDKKSCFARSAPFSHIWSVAEYSSHGHIGDASLKFENLNSFHTMINSIPPVMR